MTPVLRSGLERPVERIPLRAGPLEMVFEPELAFLRTIRVGGKEAWRGVYAAVRDRNWGTVKPVLRDLRVETHGGGFRVTFQAECREAPIHFVWRGEITGDAAGRVRYSMEGEARSAFLRNRIGFCVLHASELCAGQPCRVKKTNGAVEQGEFPRLIAPHQPFMDLAAIDHFVDDGLWARAEFEGDVFEMEDQRNWIDASFKTYCTPLAWPFPVAVKAGAKVAQSVTLSLLGEARGAVVSGVRRVELVADESERRPLPALGLGLAMHAGALTDRDRARLRALRLAHLRVDVRPSMPASLRAFHEAARVAEWLEAPLEVALLLSDNAESEVRAVASLFDEMTPHVRRWLLLAAEGPASREEWAALGRKYLLPLTRGASIAGGTNAFFTELNRNRPAAGAFDEYAWSTNPQVHAFDNLSMAETVVAMGDTVETARSFARGRGLVVSPITLKMRFNPNATVADARDPLRYSEARVDSRQMSLFCAAWTLGAIAAHAAAGVRAMTVFETHGACGVLRGDRAEGVPAWFPASSGAVYPAYLLLRALAEVRQGSLCRLECSHPMEVAALLVEREGRRRLLAANLTERVQRVRLRASSIGSGVRWRCMDEENGAHAMSEPDAFSQASPLAVEVEAGWHEFYLPAYATRIVDWGTGV